jgi:predicted small secreted protein
VVRSATLAWLAACLLAACTTLENTGVDLRKAGTAIIDNSARQIKDNIRK